MFNPERQPREVEKTAEEDMEEGESLEAIEKLSLSGQDRMNLVLTYLGEKPCSTIEVDYYGKSSLADIAETEKQRDELQEALKANGLEFFVLETEETDENGFDLKEFKFLISKDKRRLSELKEAVEKEDAEALGRLYGFPDTAVDAFIKGSKEGKLFETMLDEKEWWKDLSPKERKALLEEGVLNFNNFKFSKEYWKGELEQLREWQKLIQENTPVLYEEMNQGKPEFAMTKKELEEHEKQESDKDLEGIREKIDGMTDKLGMPIEDGIKETVVMFNAFHLRTVQSCWGHWKEDHKAAPWIMVHPETPDREDWYEDKTAREKAISQDEAMERELTDLLDIFYKDRRVKPDERLSFKGVEYGFKLQSRGAEVFRDFEDEKGREKLEVYRKEMQDFTEFLKKAYPKYAFKRPLD